MKILVVLFVLATSCDAGYLNSPQFGPHQASQAVQTYAPPAPVGQDGNVIDTLEVAQAKAAHFAEFARAAARAAARAVEESKKQNEIRPSQSTYSYPSLQQPTPVSYVAQQSYETPYRPASNPIPAPVFNAVNPVNPVNPINPIKPINPVATSYPQPQAPLPQQYETRSNFIDPKSFAAAAAKATTFVPAPLAEDGTVLDTPEVAALKAARLAELAEAEARAYKYGANSSPVEGGARNYEGSQDQGYSEAVSSQYNLGTGQYGASAAAPYPGAQPFAARTFDKSFAQPPQYQSQQLVGAY